MSKVFQVRVLIKRNEFPWSCDSNGGVAVNPSRIDVVFHRETPKSIIEIRCFHGLAGYYNKFIEGFSKLSLSLTQLTRKGQSYIWDVHY